MVVDDDPAMCGLVQEVLLGAGLEVVALTSSEAAARYLARERFDALFLDVNMPAPNGFDLARRARSSGYNQRTPIVMIAGDGDPNLQNRGFDAGANFFLYKPFDRQRLLRILRVTQGSIQQERRRFQRVQVRCKASIECKGMQVHGTTLDMSLNGVLVQAAKAFPAGEAVALTLELKKGLPPIHAGGRVARVIGNDCMGIHVEKIAPADSERIQDFLLPLILSITDPEPPPQQQSTPKSQQLASITK
jgi:DNA-binding response OmpR family regulator